MEGLARVSDVHGIPLPPFLKVVDGDRAVLIAPDREGEWWGAVRARGLCDGSAGFGVDGVVRIVRLAADDAGAASPWDAGWLVVYWTADGSVGVVCDRLWALVTRYLGEHEGLGPGTVTVSTGTQVHHVHVPGREVSDAPA